MMWPNIDPMVAKQILQLLKEAAVSIVSRNALTLIHTVETILWRIYTIHVCI